MKKLFSFVAALSCAVMMMADGFSDGNYVRIGQTAMTDENAITGITPEVESMMSSGKITYDVTTHTLTLDNVTLNGNPTNALVFINTGLTVDYDMTIKLVGKNVIKSESGNGAIWMQYMAVGKKYIFSGDKNASLYVEGYGAIRGRRGQSGDNTDDASKEKYYQILRFEGGCHVEAVGLGTSAYAVSCYQLEVDGSDLHIYQASSKAIDVKKTPYTVTNATQVFNMDDDVAIAREVYPVKYDGNNFSSAQPVFSADQNWMGFGSMTYDPATRTLTLDGVKASTSKEVALEINDKSGSTDPIIIRLKGENSVSSTNSSGSALYIESPTVITSEGNSDNKIDLDARYAGIEIEAGSLTIQDNAVVYADGTTDFGIVGTEKDGKYPVLAINASKVKANGKKGCVIGVDLKLTQAAFKESDKYEMYSNNVIDKNTTNVAADVDVVIESTVKYFNVKVQEGMGAVSIWKDGANVGTSIKLTEQTTLTFKAEPAKGWHFYFWTFGGWPISDEAEYTVENLYDDGSLVAWFLKDLPSDVAWHVSSTNKIGTIKAEDWSVTNVDMQGSPTVTSAAVWKQDGDNQKIVYVTEESSKAGLEIADYNTSDNTMGAQLTIRSAQSTYYPVTALAYNIIYDKVMYMAAYNTSTSKTEIIYNGLTGNESDPFGNKALNVDIASVSKTNPIVGLAVDASGTTYVLAKGSSDDKTWVYSNETPKTSWNAILNTGIDYSNNYKTQALAIDVKTGKLMWLYDNGSSTSSVYVIDLETNEVGRAGVLGSNYSGLFQWVGKRLTLGVKSSDEELGKVSLSNGKVIGNFYEGAQVQITATPEPGCKFVQWSDGDKNAVRTITMADKNVELTAEFAWAEGITAYPIWVGGKQLHSERLSINKSNFPLIVTAGGVVYDPDSKELKMIGNFEMSTSLASLPCVTIGDGKNQTSVTVVLESKSTLTGTSAGTPIAIKKANVKIEGGGKLTINTESAPGILLYEGSTLTFEGANATITASAHAAIKSNEEKDKLVVRGSALSLSGFSLVTIGLASAEWKYCTPSPSDAYYSTTDKKFTKGDGGSDLKSVSFSADPAVRCESLEEKTGSFTMALKDGSGETFKDGVGWFEGGKEVTLTAKGATGFVFGRWEDDGNWGDPDKKDDWLKASRDITKGALDETYKALFYAQPKANVTWYGINNDKFVQYKGRDYGAGKIESTSDASNFTAGDCNGSYYYIADDANGEILRFNFSGVTKDKEQANLDKTQKIATYTGTVTDMAYSFSDSKFYLVIDCDQKLYKINGENVEEIGEFITGELKTKVSVVCIAIDGSGKKYVLSTTGYLYTVKKESAKDKEVELELVGESGYVGVAPGNKPQSMAFDHLSGELYWGEKSYLRIIDTKTAESRIAGDLGQTKGNQGIIRALHRRDRKVTVAVEIAAECKDMGTVKVGPGEETEISLLQGSSVTIVATPAEGYEFDHWAIKDDESSEIIKEASYTTSASSVTYVAYFKSPEGIDEVQSQESGVQKVLRDGTLYIIRDGKVYDATGNPVK